MQVNWKTISIAPSEGYKSSSDATTTSTTSSTIPQTEADVEASISDLFTGSTAAAGDVPDPFSLAINSGSVAAPGTSVDPLTGKTVRDDSKNPFSVPTLDDIQSNAAQQGIQLQLKDWDTFNTQYEAELSQVQGNIKQLKDLIKSGTNVDYNTQLLVLANKAVETIKEQIAGIPKMKTELQNNSKEEMLRFQAIATSKYEDTDMTVAEKFSDSTTTSDERSKIVDMLAQADINGDGYIGEPGAVGSIRIITGTSQGDVLYDPSSNGTQPITKLSSDGSPMTDGWFDSSREWVASNKGLELSSQKVGSEDFTFKVTDDGNTTEAGNHFDAKMDLAVPDYIIVKAKDGKPITTASGEDGLNYEPVDFQMENGQIVQKSSGDMSNEAQVRITSVEVTSVKAADGKGYDQVIKYMTADSTVAASIRLVGNGNMDASDFGLAINAGEGANARKDAVIIDASQMISTAKHKSSGSTPNAGGTMDDYYKAYNVDVDSLDNAGSNNSNKESSFLNNMNHFASASGSDSHVDEGSAEATGLMAYGLTGHITGAQNANNIVFFGKPDVKSIYGDDGKIAKEYGNIYTGGNKFDVAFNGGYGNFYATDVTLAWNKARDAKTTSAITVKAFMGANVLKDNASADSTLSTDFESPAVQTFVYLGGVGDKLVDNQSDGDPTGGSGADNGNLNPDDYYNTGGHGIFTNGINGQLFDPDADGKSADGNSAPVGPDAIAQEISDLEDTITKKDTTTDNVAPPLTSDEIGGDFYHQIADSQQAFYTGISKMFSKNTLFSADTTSTADTSSTVTKDGKTLNNM